MGRELDIEALYARHRDDLLTYFVRRTADGEVALDLWAETFAEAVSSRRRFRGRTAGQESAWLYGIASRQFARYLRRGYAEQRAIRRIGLERPPTDPSLVAAVELQAGMGDLRRALADALAMLGEETRKAVELRVVHELPYPEVARRLEITEQAARARVSRGLQALSRLLDPQILREATSS